MHIANKPSSSIQHFINSDLHLGADTGWLVAENFILWVPNVMVHKSFSLVFETKAELRFLEGDQMLVNSAHILNQYIITSDHDLLSLLLRFLVYLRGGFRLFLLRTNGGLWSLGDTSVFKRFVILSMMTVFKILDWAAIVLLIASFGFPNTSSSACRCHAVNSLRFDHFTMLFRLLGSAPLLNSFKVIGSTC